MNNKIKYITLLFDNLFERVKILEPSLSRDDLLSLVIERAKLNHLKEMEDELLNGNPCKGKEAVNFLRAKL